MYTDLAVLIFIWAKMYDKISEKPEDFRGFIHFIHANTD
jgi:hypothetical protein